MAPTVNQSRKSPNRSGRDGHVVRLVLIHATVGGLESSLNWLCNPAARVSAHYVISKSGTLYQLVAETEAAWHAGDAVWQGETAINEISIGIELENRTGMDGFIGQDPYPDVQVAALIDLSRNLMSRYPGIAFARHLDVAIPKGRKSDPKGFAWLAFKAQLAQPADPFSQWGAIGLPLGEARNFAIPRAWLVNKKLGKCIASETYGVAGKHSIAEFENGTIMFLVARNTTIVEMY